MGVVSKGSKKRKVIVYLVTGYLSLYKDLYSITYLLIINKLGRKYVSIKDLGRGRGGGE